MTHEEIQAVYASGPEAVIALVEFLLERMAEQEQIIAELRARVKELEDRLATDSHNSSQPPSSDRVKPPRFPSGRLPSGKRPGGSRVIRAARCAWSRRRTGSSSTVRPSVSTVGDR